MPPDPSRGIQPPAKSCKAVLLWVGCDSEFFSELILETILSHESTISHTATKLQWSSSPSFTVASDPARVQSEARFHCRLVSLAA